MVILTAENFNREVELCNQLCVIDLYADWCAPCKMLYPILQELEKENLDVKFCKINVDTQPRLAAQFRVDRIPMVAFVKDDTFLDMTIGLVTKEKLLQLLEEYK